MYQRDEVRVVQTTQLSEYFHFALHEAASQRRIRAEQATLHYLNLLLCQYARSEQVFDFDQNRLQVRPLALIYAAAVQAESRQERRLWLQRLGDLALFVGGLFAGQLSRRFRDLDYCMAMGGNAYGYLQLNAERSGEQAQAAVFGELAGQFGDFVTLIATVTGHPEEARGAAAAPPMH